jgi:hypothetical protein
MRDTLSEQLDLLADDFADEQGNWSAVLRDAGPAVDARPERRSRFRFLTARRSTVRVAAVATVAAASAFAVTLALPGGNGCGSVLACASAAIKTDGEIVHMVASIPGPDATPDNIYTFTSESWHDPKTGATYSQDVGGSGSYQYWQTASGERFVRHDNGTVRRLGSLQADGPDLYAPLYAAFGKYEQSLRDGSAKLVGETTFDGRKAYMIDFHSSDEVGPNGKVSRTAVRVLVDAETYQPIGAGVAIYGGRWIPFMPRVSKQPDGTVIPDESLKVNAEIKISSAEFTSPTPGLFDPPTS